MCVVKYTQLCIIIDFFNYNFLTSSSGHRCMLAALGMGYLPFRIAAKSPLTLAELLEMSGWFCFLCLALSSRGGRARMINDLQI